MANSEDTIATAKHTLIFARAGYSGRFEGRNRAGAYHPDRPVVAASFALYFCPPVTLISKKKITYAIQRAAARLPARTTTATPRCPSPTPTWLASPAPSRCSTARATTRSGKRCTTSPTPCGSSATGLAEVYALLKTAGDLIVHRAPAGRPHRLLPLRQQPARFGCASSTSSTTTTTTST